jgi:cytochrome c peroxidase
LSVDGTVACGTCHDPARAFADGRPVSIGVNGRAGQRNAPTIPNALYNVAQFWDGRAKTLAEQAALPIINPSEMGQPSLDAAVARIASVPEYEQAFRRVLGRPINETDLVRAIASYERTQFSFDSPFDRFLACNPYHEKLFKVASDDGDEPYSLQERVGTIRCCFQNSPLEGQQT